MGGWIGGNGFVFCGCLGVSAKGRMAGGRVRVRGWNCDCVCEGMISKQEGC